MRYDFHCSYCGTIREYACTVDARDMQLCHTCGDPVERLFQAADVVIPEAFSKWDKKDFQLTYQQCAELDKKNEAYLANKPKPKPDFDKILVDECEKRRIDPKEMYAYTVKPTT